MSTRREAAVWSLIISILFQIKLMEFVVDDATRRRAGEASSFFTRIIKLPSTDASLTYTLMTLMLKLRS